jgi:hypothetical protein
MSDKLGLYVTDRPDTMFGRDVILCLSSLYSNIEINILEDNNFFS